MSKKLLKSWLSLSIGAVMLFSLTACSGSNSTQDQTNSENTSPPAETTKTYKIGMSQCNVGEPYRETQNKQIAQAAKKYPELQVTFKDASQDSNKQVKDIEEFINEKMDLIIVSPNEPTPLDQAIKKAAEAGIPVIILERTVNGNDYTQFIKMDNTSMGIAIGEYVQKTLLPNGGKVVMMKGLESTIPGQERFNGIVQVLEKNKKFELIDKVNADWIKEKAISEMDKLLVKHNKIDCLIALNDPMAEGALESAKKAGRDKGIKFVGFDGLPTADGAMNSIIQGRLSASIIYPTGAEIAIDNAYKLLVNGEKLEKEVNVTAGEVVTPDNAKDLFTKYGSN